MVVLHTIKLFYSSYGSDNFSPQLMQTIKATTWNAFSKHCYQTPLILTNYWPSPNFYLRVSLFFISLATFVCVPSFAFHFCWTLWLFWVQRAKFRDMNQRRGQLCRHIDQKQGSVVDKIEQDASIRDMAYRDFTIMFPWFPNIELGITAIALDETDKVFFCRKLFYTALRWELYSCKRRSLDLHRLDTVLIYSRENGWETFGLRACQDHKFYV